MDQAQLQSLINAILASSDPTWVEVTQMIFSGMGIAAIIIGYLQLISLNKQMKSTILTLPMRDISEHSWTVPANTS